MAKMSQRVVMRIARSVSPPQPAPTPNELPASPAEALVAKADAARDQDKLAVAAELYAEALRLDPTLGPIHVQAGHMFKETATTRRLSATTMKP